jgi:hypothetical protein
VDPKPIQAGVVRVPVIRSDPQADESHIIGLAARASATFRPVGISWLFECISIAGRVEGLGTRAARVVTSADN